MEKEFNRKVVLTRQSTLFSTSTDPNGAGFKIGTYHDNMSIEDGVVCLYLSVPQKTIMAYWQAIRALNHANILSPVTYCKVGEDNQYYKVLFENKITWQLKEFVEKMRMRLFEPKVEHGKTVFGMSLMLQKIIMEIMTTLDDMHMFDLVHGHLSVENTGIYLRGTGDLNEDYQTKLFGFGVENIGDTDLMKKKNEDWKMLGTLIKEIFKIHQLPMACCAEDLAVSFQVDPPKPEGIGFYRGHPNFFNIGNKEALIKSLVSSRLDEVQHSVRMPAIPAKYKPPPGRLTLEGVLCWLGNEFEHNKDTVQFLIADIEEVNPLIWIQLLELIKKVEPK